MLTNPFGGRRVTAALSAFVAGAALVVGVTAPSAAQEPPEAPTKLVMVQAAAVEGTPIVRVNGFGAVPPGQAVTTPDGQWQDLIFEVSADTTINDLRITYLGGEERPGDGDGGVDPGPAPVPGGRTVEVRARGNLGTEEADLYVNGSLVESFPLSTGYQTFTYESPEPVADVRVGHDSGVWPNAVVVDHIDVDGTRYESEDPAVVSKGAWTVDTGCAIGNKESEWLSCNDAYFDYPIPPIANPGSGTIQVRARGNLGTEEADLYVNGSLVESFDLSTDYQTFTYESAAEVTSLRVGHDSGSWPNAVVVDYVDVDGDRYQSEDPGVVSKGSWTTFTGCEIGNRESEWLSCDDAYFDYPLASDDDLFRIVVRARGNQGTETAELAVNGEPVASWDVSTEFQEFVFLSPASRIDGVTVSHNSGNWPNALIVDRVDADWQRMEMEFGSATGQWTPADGCGAVDVPAISEWLACDGGSFRYGLTLPLLPGGPERAAVRIGEVTIDGATYSALDPGVSKVPAKNCEPSNAAPDVIDCLTEQFAFIDVQPGPGN